MSEEKEKVDKFPYEFIDAMLNSVGENVGDERAAEIVGSCCTVHYEALNIDELVQKYTGDIEGFISLVTDEWGWKVIYNKKEGIIEIDENKPFCVCPLVEKGNIKNPILCRCSESFNGRMFGRVLEKDVDAKVVKSVLKGDKSCVYRIKIK